MDEEDSERQPNVEISSSKSQASSGLERAAIVSSVSSSVCPNVYSDSLVATKKSTRKTSPSIREKIRSSLPNIGHHLRRLMKFKTSRESRDERENSDVAMSSTTGSSIAVIAQRAEANEDDVRTPTSCESLGFINSTSGFIEENSVGPIVVSTSSMDLPSVDDSKTSEHDSESRSTTSRTSVQPTVPVRVMVSSGTDASMDDLPEDIALASVVAGEGAIIAGDPSDFAAALDTFGYDRIRTYAELQARREEEPQNIPLQYLQNDHRLDSYIESPVSGEQGSSTSGSENSVSEVGEVSTETSVSEEHDRDGRDEAQHYYDAALRAAVRKRFRHFDDEPPIY